MSETRGTQTPDLLTPSAEPATLVPPDVPPASGEPSAGRLLSVAREAAGLSLDALSQTLKVSPTKLEALERDQFDQLPSPMFTRALASSVCRVLGIESAPVLALLPQSGQVSFDAAQASLNAPFRGHGESLLGDWLAQLKRPVVLAVLALLAGAALLWWLPTVPLLDSLMGRSKEATTLATAATAEVPMGNSVPADITPPPAAPVAPLLVPAQTKLVAPPDIPPPSLTAASRLGSEPIPTGLVSFKARSESWVEVTDAKGKSKLRRLLNAGELVQVDAAAPVSVVVGRADAVEVLVRGQPLDIAARARDNVARFEVK